MNESQTSTQRGSLIDGKYEVLSLIGRGGMSLVWLVRDNRLNKLWAVKELRRTAKDSNNAIVVQSLLTEAELLKKLDHPALPRIVDIIEERDTIYVVMDYVEGESLNKTLRRVGHAMPQEDVINWGLQLCDVLGYLHSRTPAIIYRDMKPGNVMLQEDGTVKLIDFGIAREYKDDHEADTKTLGTMGYAAPEQFSKTVQTDPRTDIYSLGVTLHHLVTGRAPSEDTLLRPIREINPHLSAGLEYVIVKATQPEPAKRYQSCAEMAYDLENYEKLTDEYRKEQRGKVNRFTALCAAAAICFVLGAGCIATSLILKNSTYESYMSKAETASTTAEDDGESEAEGYYLSAIETSSDNLDPYMAIVELYKSDNTFTAAEATRWTRLFSEYRETIEDDEEYAQLCYDVAILYYVYYERDADADFSSTGITLAKQWFDYAIDSYEDRLDAGRSCTLTEAEYDAAIVYTKISEFYANFDQNSIEGNDRTAYEEFYQSLNDALDVINKDASVATAVRLRLYEIIYAVISSPTYLGKFFLIEDIDEADIEAMLLEVLEGTAELEQEVALNDDFSAICQQILSGVDTSDIEGTISNSDAWKTIKSVYETVGSKYGSTTEDDSADEEADVS